SHRPTGQRAGHDAGQEGEEVELRRLDGQMESLDQIEGVVGAQAGAVHVLGEEQEHEDAHRSDDLRARQLAVTRRRPSYRGGGARGGGGGGVGLCAYQRPICSSTTMAISAAVENHPMLDCPCGTTTNAASNGPVADPIFPPTWNRDWASPYRPPAAIRATREA